MLVEKPTGHTINESRAMVKAAKDSGVVVQVGLHRRIGPHHVQAMEFLKSGQVGKVGMVRLFAASKGGPETPKPNSKVPDGMDWDMWCGPAPMRPFNTKLHPGGWRAAGRRTGVYLYLFAGVAADDTEHVQNCR